MNAFSKNVSEGDPPRDEAASELQTPDEGHAHDVAELVKIATSLALELERATKR